MLVRIRIAKSLYLWLWRIVWYFFLSATTCLRCMIAVSAWCDDVANVNEEGSIKRQRGIGKPGAPRIVLIGRFPSFYLSSDSRGPLYIYFSFFSFLMLMMA